MQTKKCPIASDSKHNSLFHRWLTPNLQRIEQDYKKEDLTYTNDFTSRKLNKEKQIENLIKMILNPIL